MLVSRTVFVNHPKQYYIICFNICVYICLKYLFKGREKTFHLPLYHYDIVRNQIKIFSVIISWTKFKQTSFKFKHFSSCFQCLRQVTRRHVFWCQNDVPRLDNQRFKPNQGNERTENKKENFSRKKMCLTVEFVLWITFRFLPFLCFGDC